MAERAANADALRPGTRARHVSGRIVTLDRRKHQSEHDPRQPWQPGWWVIEGGGLADYVLDDPHYGWTVLDD
jgi:hypothetical protein